MLVRAAKPSFDSLREAAKQLVICTFIRKQEYSLHQNDYNSNYRGDRRRRFTPKKKWDMDFEGDDFDVQPLKLDNLTPYEKNFYKPHPNVANRSQDEIQSFYKKHQINVFGNSTEKCPPPVFSFDELDLPSETKDIIRNLNYTEPTPIQSQTWPIALSGLNMVGVAQTGSGKTLGFVLPGMIHIKHQPPRERGDGPLALVLSPTRELAQQIDKVFVPFAESYNFRTACVFGGASKEKQSYSLRNSHVCVGTPGRVLDFLRSGNLNLRRCTYFVLDEADRLLNMGFEPQIRAIMNRMRSDSQILMWSATWPKEVQTLASDQLNNYIGIKFGSSELSANPNITQHIHVCEKHEKRDLFLKLLADIFKEPDSKTLVYVQTKRMADIMNNLLRRNGYRVGLLHGDISQGLRDRTFALFRSGQIQVLVGTGLIGRGLDVTDIKYVINYDFPMEIEDYVHVIGRTGRSQNKGTAHTFFTEDDERYAKDLIKILKQSNQEVPPELMNFVNDRREFHSRQRDFHSSRYRRHGSHRSW